MRRSTSSRIASTVAMVMPRRGRCRLGDVSERSACGVPWRRGDRRREGGHGPHCCGPAWRARDPPGHGRPPGCRSPPTRVCRRRGSRPSAVRALRRRSGRSRRHVADPLCAARSIRRDRGPRPPGAGRRAGSRHGPSAPRRRACRRERTLLATSSTTSSCASASVVSPTWPAIHAATAARAAAGASGAAASVTSKGPTRSARNLPAGGASRVGGSDSVSCGRMRDLPWIPLRGQRTRVP